MFRRKGKGESSSPDGLSESAADRELVQEADLPEALDADPVASDNADSAGGPYDLGEAPSDDIPRLDLGSLRVPIIDGLGVRLDMDETTGEPTQLIIEDGESLMQLGVFAAPKSTGIWAEIRAEIAQSLTGTGGSAAETKGPLGAELTASVPTGDPSIPFAPARFIGVDRPRWFLRGLISGPAAVDAVAAARLEFALRETIVVRGMEAMPIRDPPPAPASAGGHAIGARAVAGTGRGASQSHLGAARAGTDYYRDAVVLGHTRDTRLSRRGRKGHTETRFSVIAESVDAESVPRAPGPGRSSPRRCGGVAAGLVAPAY